MSQKALAILNHTLNPGMVMQSRVFIEQIKILYERAPTVIPINVLISSILAVILAGIVPPAEIFSWLAAMFLVSVIRYTHVKYVLHQMRFNEQAKRLEIEFLIASLSTSLVWVLVFVLYYDRVPSEYLIFIIFALGGMSVGAVASMASSPLVFFTFVTPMVLSPMIAFALKGDALGYAMASMMMIYYLSIGSTYYRSYQLITESIGLQLDKDALIQHLKISNQHLEMANEKIITLSHTDELTQVANRRYLDITLNKEWGRAVRSTLPISFVMLDIDFFKAYNDTFGHQQGDECLQQIAAVLKNLVKRPGDFVARYGGEEFAIILPDTRMQGAYELMHELQKHILELHIPAADKSVSAFVTVSIGIASMMPVTTDELHDFVLAADAALYSAKHKGRNRIETDNIQSAASPLS